jgi:hypothetical protein
VDACGHRAVRDAAVAGRDEEMPLADTKSIPLDVYVGLS